MPRTVGSPPEGFSAKAVSGADVVPHLPWGEHQHRWGRGSRGRRSCKGRPSRGCCCPLCPCRSPGCPGVGCPCIWGASLGPGGCCCHGRVRHGLLSVCEQKTLSCEQNTQAYLFVNKTPFLVNEMPKPWGVLQGWEFDANCRQTGIFSRETPQIVSFDWLRVFALSGPQ